MSKAVLQTTIGREVQAKGSTLHGGETVRLRLLPAAAGEGIRFVRADLPDAPELAASHALVDASALQRRTELAAPGGARVATTEHLLAACLGIGLDNLRVELDGPEVPIFDGSVDPFLALIDKGGIRNLDVPRKVLRLLRPVSLIEEDREIIAVPAESMQLAFFAQLGRAGMPNQAAQFELGDVKRFREMAIARTWVFYEDIERLRQADLIRGGTLANAIVLRDGKPVGGGGEGEGDYRLPNELACHKLLDLLGDLALLGRPLAALVTARGSGHAMHQAFIKRLAKELEDPL